MLVFKDYTNKIKIILFMQINNYHTHCPMATTRLYENTR